MLGAMMEWIESHRGISYGVAVLLVAATVFSFWRGQRLFFRGLRSPGHPSQTMWVVRGIRGWIIGIGLLCFAGGLVWAAKWPLIFGCVFLGEELFETGIMLLALKSSGGAGSATPDVDP